MLDPSLFLAQSQLMQTVDWLARTPLSVIVQFAVVLTVVRLALAPIIAKTPAHKRTGAFGLVKFGNELADAMVYAAILIFMLVRPFALQTFSIPSESMVPTLLVGDLLVINKAVYRSSNPGFQDIVVFRPPSYACLPGQLDEKGEPKVDFIKRCIGLPGDLIEFKGGDLYRNGQKVDEKYRAAPSPFDFKLVEHKGAFWPVTMAYNMANSQEAAMIAPKFQAIDSREMKELMDAPAVKVPPSHYLMVGDNRPGSYDGRAWGLIHRDDVVGRAEAIWFPLGRMKMLR